MIYRYLVKHKKDLDSEQKFSEYILRIAMGHKYLDVYENQIEKKIERSWIQVKKLTQRE